MPARTQDQCLKPDSHSNLQAATKSQRAEKGKGRSATLQPNLNTLPRSSSVLSSRHSVRAADSDSDETTGRSLLTTAAGSASQRRQTQLQIPRAEARPVTAATAAASSDSDDDLLHAAHAKQSQLLSSKQLSQVSAAVGLKATGRNAIPASAHPRQGAPGGSLPRALERATSRDSTSSGKALPQSLVTQTSLQRSMASAGSSLAARQKFAAQNKAVAQSDADSDEERWAGIAARAARPSTQFQVNVF